MITKREEVTERRITAINLKVNWKLNSVRRIENEEMSLRVLPKQVFKRRKTNRIKILLAIG